MTNLDSILKSRDITLQAKVCLVKAVVHIHNGMLLSYWKECSWVSSNEVDETRTYYTEWSKPVRETPMQYFNAYRQGNSGWLFFFWVPKPLQIVIAAMKLKDTPWKESYDQSRQHIKKQRHYFANKGLSGQGYSFSSGHVWMWELDCKESWALKNWCFWTVVLEKTLESPLDCKEIQPVHPKGVQSWVFIGRTDFEAETPIFWPPHVKSWLIGKDSDAGRDWGQEEKGTTEDEMVGWHQRLNAHEFE